MEQQNVEVLCQLSKEVESTVLGMKMMQSQMARELQEKENLKESQRKIKDLRGEVLKLNSEIFEKDRCYEARLKELELKIQGNEASLISWNKEKEVTFLPTCEFRTYLSFQLHSNDSIIASLQ